MNEMIERVARALHSEFNESGRGDYTYEWDHPLASRGYFRGQARAAIEAMREPTEAMIESGATSEDAVLGSSELCAAATYRTMLDAALTPQSNSTDHPNQNQHSQKP